jgi:diadenosine tetraphosphate (Ap4A) HIT family hydrolase
MSDSPSCPFCSPDTERIAFERPLVLALWDAFPVSPGHMLVVPRRHVPTWFDATAEEHEAIRKALDEGRQLIAGRHGTATTSA